MKILIANPGSTSYKCKLYETDNMSVLFQATVERIGEMDAICTTQLDGEEALREVKSIPDYENAVKLTLDALSNKYQINDVLAVGFKTVLAKDVNGCVPLTKKAIQGLKDYLPLAPVHNQVYLTAIDVFQNLLPQTPLVGLFETAFHTEIPLEAALYGVPYEWFEKYGVRKYGFHGASHRYIGERSKELFGQDAKSWNVISCHLGGSSSVCAIQDGKSIDTSMGMSPQSGLLNAKRVGDLDPFALLYVMEKENLSIEQMRDVLINKSGIYGLSGSSSDFRDLIQDMENGDERAKLTFDTFAYVVKRYIGEYLAILNGADVIVFTAGAGQHQPKLREAILRNMDNIGVKLDLKLNNENPEEGLISSADSKVKIAVIPTQEEFIVTREVVKYLKSL